MITAHEVKNAMNESARRGESFLFGVDFELTHGFFLPNPKQCTDVLWRVGNCGNADKKDFEQGTYFQALPWAKAEYQQKFDVVYDGLMRGNSYLLNLTMKTPLRTDYTLEEIFHRCNSPYAVFMPETFVCFSPETFVRIANGIISSNPMKGTIKSSVPDAEQVILNDYKETAEHYTIVDLIRNDLSRVATHVKVDALRYIDRLKTSHGEILQVSSKISGMLPEDYKQRLGDILFELLPAGSVSGAPKLSTIDIIKRAEREPRGFYCGVFGYYDGECFDSAVMIRFIEQYGGNFFFRSGSGITINSTPDYEYDESIDKIYLPFL